MTRAECTECAQSVHRVHSPRYFYIFLNSFATHQVRVLAHEPGSSAPITPGLFSNRGRGRRAPCSIELSAASSDFRVETGESLRRAGKGRTDATLSVRLLGRAESARALGSSEDLCWGIAIGAHSILYTSNGWACFSRVILGRFLVVSYIGLYLSWVSPRVLHLWPNYPPPDTCT